MIGRTGLLLCFFLSGASALLYETAWSTLLSAVFGTSQLAVAAVLVATMGGLAVGAALAARIGRRLARPVLAYAVLELAIGLAALTVEPLMGVARRLQWLVLGVERLDQLPPGWASMLFYLVASIVVLLIPTVLMGATLPILAGALVRDDLMIGRFVGILYATNTIGAAVGALACAFLVLPLWGLGATVWTGVGLNLLVAFMAATLSRRELPRPETTRPVSASGPRWALPVIAFSGAVAFILEVMWTRLLGQIVGSSVQGFALLLAVFLSGLALGSAAAARRATDRASAARTLFASQIVVGVSCLVSFALAPWLLPRAALPGFLTLLAFAAAVLLPSGTALGAAFPSSVRLRAACAREATSAAGQVLLWNTAGAIAGALLATLLLLPQLRFVGTVKVAAATAFLLSSVVAAFAFDKRTRCAVAALAALLTLTLPLPTPGAILQRSVLSVAQGAEPVFYEVGRAATVLLRPDHSGWRLTTDGLPESTIQKPGAWVGATAVARWLSRLPLALRPESRSLLVIGLGGAQSLQGIPSSVKEIDVVEIEEQVLAANRYAGPWRQEDPLQDPRVRIHLTDARSALMLASSRFDAIVSQPSHPWTAGSSHLFTREFFELVRSRLEANGVFVQWLAVPFVDTELLRTTLATLHDVFDHVELYAPGTGSALLLVASRAPLDPDPGPFLEAWSELGVSSRDDLLMARLLDTEGSVQFAGNARLTTDRRNAFASRGIEVLRRGKRGQTWEELLAQAALDPEVDRYYAGRRYVELGSLNRATALLPRLDDSVSRESLAGLIALAQGRRVEARKRCEGAFRLSRTSPSSLLCLYRLHRSELERGSEPAVRWALEAAEPSRTLLAARDALSRGDWRAAREHEDALAAVPAFDPFHREAQEIRIEWRQASGEPRYGREAMALIDSLLARGGGIDLRLRRAEAAFEAGEADIAAVALEEIAPQIPRFDTLWSRCHRLAAELGIDLEFFAALEKQLRE